MKLNVLLFATSEAGMDYLFTWLESTLNKVCASCDTDSMLIRRICPPDMFDLWDGMAELREVGVIESLTWESEPLRNNWCHLRRVSFTLAAGDPCMYSEGVPITFNVLDAAAVPTCYAALPLAEGKADCRPRCIDLPASCRSSFTFTSDTVGAAAPVLTMTNDNAGWVPPLRAICYADPHQIGVDHVQGPCGLTILGEVYIRPLAPWSEFVWDVAGRKTWYADTGSSPVTGYSYVDPNDPPIPRFFTLPCGWAHIVVEPSNWCLEVDTPGDRYIYSGIEFDNDDIHFPTMTLEVVERRGCA